MEPILLLHGALGSRTQLEPLKNLLEQQGATVLSFDFIGHSREPFTSTFGIQAFSNQLIEFLDRHKIQRCDIFGYSMGGYVALYTALHHPSRLRRVVTLGTKFDWSPESASQEVRKMNADKILEKIPAFARILEQRHGEAEWRKLLAETATMMTGLGDNPLLTTANTKEIAPETLVLLGDQDDMADREFSQTIASTLPNGTFSIIEDTPHPIEKVDRNKLASILLQHFLQLDN